MLHTRTHLIGDAGLSKPWRVGWITLGLSITVGLGHAHAAQMPPVPANPQWAQTSLGYNPKTRCPEVRMADEGPTAVVVFWLPSSGTPSHIAVKSSSGSDALDSAAMSCVAKLRFAPATTLGSGDPIASWQQVAFRWAEQNSQAAANGAAAAAGGAAPTVAAKGQGGSSGAEKTATVHVCVDEAGKLKQDPTLVRSSGLPSVDQAALKIAASGAAYYRPDTTSSGQPASGCAQLAIKFDTP